MMGKVLYILTALLMVFQLSAQPQSDEVERIINDIYYQLDEEGKDIPEYEQLYEGLLHYTQQPVNLNHTNRQELQQLYFLSDLQIENILYHIYQYGPLESIYELRLIDGLEDYDIRNLLPFVYVGEHQEQKELFHPKELYYYGKHQLLLRMDKGLETKEGYRFLPEEDEAQFNSNEGYKGDPFYASIRYQYTFKDKLNIGLRMEKDAGEQFWGDYNKGFDSYGGYVQIDKLKWCKRIIIGDFKANFGNGLVMNTDFGFGKSADVLNTTPRSQGIRKTNSTDEYNFFRGVGGSFQWNRWEANVFYSIRRLDADTTGGYIHSIYTTGLHRTDNEYAKRNTVWQQVIGANMLYRQRSWKVGLSMAATLFNKPIIPQPTLYNTNYFSGKHQLTVGTDYQWRIKRFFLFGETALTQQLGWATLNGVKFYPIPELGLVTLQRYYSGKFDSFFAQSFSETSALSNEKGIYIGIEAIPGRFWRIAAYADTYSFPFPKYGINKPSTGFDYLLQAEYTPKTTIKLVSRLKWEEKMTNYTGTQLVVPLDKTSARCQFFYQSGHLSFKTTMEGNLAKKGSDDFTFGYQLAQDITYRNENFPLSGNIRLQMFHADTYDNRIYSYENDVLYAFSIPMLTGSGCRYYINLRYDLFQTLTLWLKMAQTIYADGRETVGTGHEERSGNRKTDFRLLIRYKF